MNSSMESSKPGVCGFDQSLAALRNISFFSGMPLEPLKALAYFCKRANYQEGDYLFRQDDLGDQGFCIMEGTVQVIRETPDGENVVRELKQGEFVGGMSLVTNAKRLYSLKAASPVCCLVLPQKLFLPQLAKSPEFAQAYFKALYRSIMEWEEALLKRTEDNPGDHVGVSLI